MTTTAELLARVDELAAKVDALTGPTEPEPRPDLCYVDEVRVGDEIRWQSDVTGWSEWVTVLSITPATIRLRPGPRLRFTYGMDGLHHYVVLRSAHAVQIRRVLDHLAAQELRWENPR